MYGQPKLRAPRDPRRDPRYAAVQDARELDRLLDIAREDAAFRWRDVAPEIRCEATGESCNAHDLEDGERCRLDADYQIESGAGYTFACAGHVGFLLEPFEVSTVFSIEDAVLFPAETPSEALCPPGY